MPEFCECGHTSHEHWCVSGRCDADWDCDCTKFRKAVMPVNNDKEWPDVPALLAEARDALGRVNTNAFERDLLFQYRGGVLGRELTLIVRDLADALEIMRDLYRQADTSAVNLIAEKDELQARIGATMALDDAGLLRAPTSEADGNA